MRSQTISKIRVSIFLLASMLAVTPAHAACSNASLKGVYGYYHGHGVLNGNDVVGQFTADGKGSLSASWTWSSYGTIFTGTSTGTYSIAKNCTGSLTLDTEEFSPTTFAIVFDNNQTAFQMIDTNNDTAQPGFGFAQGTVTCGLTGQKQTMATNLSGVLTSTGQFQAAVGQLTLSGKGKLSGTVTISVGGTISTASVTGTYTENADCTGTAKITPKGSTATNFNTVVVNGGQEVLLIETDNDTLIVGTAQE